jgi:hypothetical protein
MNASQTACARGGKTALVILGLALAAGVAMIGSRVLLKGEPHGAVLALAIALPLPFMAGLVLVIARASRDLDEMYRRIQFEALALTVPVSALLLVLYGQLQKAGIMPPEDAAMGYAVISLTYAACYFIAARRYH